MTNHVAIKVKMYSFAAVFSILSLGVMLAVPKQLLLGGLEELKFFGLTEASSGLW